MTTYLDASVVVSLVTAEAHSARVEGWVLDNAGDGFATSAWVSVEVASALSIKMRSGALSDTQRAAAAHAWRRFREGLGSVPIDPASYLTAELWTGQTDLGLRAGDALHIAIANAGGCALATLDRRMAEAATALGVPVVAILYQGSLT